MARPRGTFDREFWAEAVRIARDTGRPVAQVARDLGDNESEFGNWVRQHRAEPAGGLSVDGRAELPRVRKENATLSMERDVLKRSADLWVNEATR